VRDFSQVEDPSKLLFMVPMRPVRQILFLRYTSSEDDPVEVPAVIDEERYKVVDGHKVTLKSLLPGFGKEHFYQSDLCLLIRNGTVKVYRQTEELSC
jgi:hypothetical protein